MPTRSDSATTAAPPSFADDALEELRGGMGQAGVALAVAPSPPLDPDGSATYEAGLDRVYFDHVVAGRKRIEVRVRYPKWRNLAAGDRIRFTCEGQEQWVR